MGEASVAPDGTAGKSSMDGSGRFEPPGRLVGWIRGRLRAAAAPPRPKDE